MQSINQHAPSSSPRLVAGHWHGPGLGWRGGWRRSNENVAPEDDQDQAPEEVDGCAPSESSVAADLQEQLAEARKQLAEALEQQTATSEVLRSSPVRPASWSRCSRPCWRTRHGSARPSSAPCSLYEDDAFRTVAIHNAPPAYAEMAAARTRVRPARTPRLGRVARTKQFVHIADLTKEQAYIDGDPLSSLRRARRRPHVLVVPMLKDDELIGAISIYRQEVRPFSDKQIELVAELRQPGGHRDREHPPAQRAASDEISGAQQTATSEVLQVISSSPGELGTGVPRDAGERNRASARPSSATCFSTRASFRHVALHNAPPLGCRRER